mgnify:FL=1
MLGPYKLNQIYCGECSAMMDALPDGCIDFWLTSPPYDNQRTYHGYTFDFERIAMQLYRVTKPGGVGVWVVADGTEDFCESLTSAKQKIYFVEGCGFNLLDTMIYQKDGYPAQYPGMMRYMGAFEYMIILSKGRPGTYNPIRDRINKSIGERSKFTQRQKDGSTKYTNTGFTIGKLSNRNNIWTYPTGYLKVTGDREAYSHPAIFPESLARDHIISWSNPGDLVLDPMVGSGTTAKQAHLLGRHYLGFDISEEYCQLARRRVANVEAQPFLLPPTVEVNSKLEQLSMLPKEEE